MSAIYDCLTAVFDESADWIDDRHTDEHGKLQGYVIHKGSDERYGHLSQSDTDGEIRTKLALLALTAIPRAIFSGFFRTSYLISGYWIWGQEVLEASANWDKEKGNYELSKRVVSCSLKHFARAILTCVTYPLNLILGIGCFFVSIPRPLLARRLFAQIEEAWSLPTDPPSFFISTLNFQAPCMQPQRVWKEYNLRETHLCSKINTLLKIPMPRDVDDNPL